MLKPGGLLSWRPTRVGAIAGTMVIGGLVLTQIASWWFLLLAAAGAFGPGILREVGVLRDKDEFERAAARRAGYHAYLVTGCLAFALYAFTRSGHGLASPEELSGLYLALLTFTWMFSSLFAYWGPRRAAYVILLVFGTAWGVFNVWSNLLQPTHMAMQLLFTTAPFFVLAFASRRWPRISGALLFALSVTFLILYFRDGNRFPFVVRAQTTVFFIGPLLAAGIALLGARRDSRQARGDLGPESIRAVGI